MSPSRLSKLLSSEPSVSARVLFGRTIEALFLDTPVFARSVPSRLSILKSSLTTDESRLEDLDCLAGGALSFISMMRELSLPGVEVVKSYGSTTSVDDDEVERPGEAI